MADVTINIGADTSEFDDALSRVTNAGNNVQPPTPPITPPQVGTPPSGGGIPTPSPTPSNPPITPPNNPPINPPTPPVPPSNPPTTPPNNPPTTPPNNPPIGNNGTDSPAIPTYDRMAQDIRREILSRGALMVPGSSNYNQLMNTISQQTKAKEFSSIESRFNDRRRQLADDYIIQTAETKDKIEEERQKALAQPFANEDRINRRYDAKLQRTLQNIDDTFRAQNEQLDIEESGEKQEVEKNLAKVIQELTNELKQGNSNSYLGKLRTEYREALWRRDNAETEDEARAAGDEAAAIQKRISRAMAHRDPVSTFRSGLTTALSLAGMGTKAYETYLHSEGAKISEVRAAANGDVFGAMQQELERQKMTTTGYWAAGTGAVGAIVGGVVSALTSYGLGTWGGAAIGAGAGGAAGGFIGNAIFNLMHGDEVNQVKLGQLWADQEKRMQQFTDLALIARSDRGSFWGHDNMTIDEARISLIENAGAYLKAGMNFDIDAHALGMTNAEASQKIAQRVKQRGYSEGLLDDSSYAMSSMALEKIYMMNEGSLAQLSAYDRYGNNANQDMANLIASLNKRNTLGMSGGQTLRANEFMSYQIQLMEQQKSWMNPNSAFAQRQLLAAQNAFGDNLDNRAITELGQINNAVTNPQEGYAKVMTYDVIQQLFPETRGNLLAIKQKMFSNNPEDRAKIEKAMFEKINSVYGGIDTTSGYLAFSQYTGIQDPDRLAQWVKTMRRGLPTVTKGNVANDIRPLENYLGETSKEMLTYQDDVTKAIAAQTEELRGVSQTLIRTFKEKMNEIIKELKN